MISEISVEELDGVLAEGVVLIDVRMPDEYEEQRVPGAVLIPLPELPERFVEIPTGGVIHLICRSGARSMKACEFLSAKGYETLNVIGGTTAWAESGRPTESGSL
ncbi:MAG: rhodanese-like domain-containing protein [Microthrixaceae bacterium]